MTVNKFDGTAFTEVAQVGGSDGSGFADSSVNVRREGGAFEQIWPSGGSDQLFRDFESETLGEQPANTTLRRSSVAGDYLIADDNTTRTVEYNNTSGAASGRGLSFPELSPSGTTELFATVRDTGTDPDSARLVAFATDDPSNEYGAIFDGGNGELDIYRRDGGSFSSLASVSTAPQTTTERVNLRFRVTPSDTTNTLQLRAWLDGNAEPATWDVETTDGFFDLNNGPLAGGWIGFVGFDGNGGSVFYDRVGIGVDGAEAPTQ